MTGRMESYEIPEDMAGVLPEKCPELHFATCAVVGNSGTMLHEQYGPEINAHQMVYRFNQVCPFVLLITKHKPTVCSHLISST